MYAIFPVVRFSHPRELINSRLVIGTGRFVFEPDLQYYSIRHVSYYLNIWVSNLFFAVVWAILACCISDCTFSFRT